MKVVLVFAGLVAVVLSQRPPYAAQPQVYPKPHPWFTSSTTAATTLDLGNRAGAAEAAAPVSTTTASTTTIRLPIDVRGDVDLYNQIASWPREKQPYWFINWQQIEAARARPQPIQDNNQPFSQSGISSRSSFLAGRRT